MKYTKNIQKAIRFATVVHEVHQKQKRKGKDEAYIAHPLTVGLILSQATDDEDVIVAGILHDTVEDCSPDHPITLEMIEKEFGTKVRDLVSIVTEENPDAPYDERKAAALEHVSEMSEEQVLVKSADVISNMTELMHDYAENGESVFDRFNADKVTKLTVQLRMLQTLVKRWSESPLANDLSHIAWRAYDMGGIDLMQKYSSQKMEYREYDENTHQTCPICHWEGIGEVETHDALMEVSCKFCTKTLLIVNDPHK